MVDLRQVEGVLFWIKERICYMVFEEFINAIANVGFPIGCVIYFAYYTKDLNESHQKESKELCEKINDLTLKIQQLIDRLE